MCSSLYHFGAEVDEVIEKMRRAARQGVVISEPVRNLSSAPVVGPLFAALTRAGVGSSATRFDLARFAAVVARHGGELTHDGDARNALAVFRS